MFHYTAPSCSLQQEKGRDFPKILLNSLRQPRAIDSHWRASISWGSITHTQSSTSAAEVLPGQGKNVLCYPLRIPHAREAERAGCLRKRVIFFEIVRPIYS